MFYKNNVTSTSLDELFFPKPRNDILNHEMEALDAEKAFDKLWRDGLFFKLINKIDKLSWITLRRYYCISEGIIVFEDKKQKDSVRNYHPQKHSHAYF